MRSSSIVLATALATAACSSGPDEKVLTDVQAKWQACVAKHVTTNGGKAELSIPENPAKATSLDFHVEQKFSVGEVKNFEYGDDKVTAVLTSRSKIFSGVDGKDKAVESIYFDVPAKNLHFRHKEVEATPEDKAVLAQIRTCAENARRTLTPS